MSWWRTGAELAFAGSLIAMAVPLPAAGEPAPGSRGGNALEAAAGRALFERIWVPAPASTAATDGLGPLFNARSCAACHEKGGRGRIVLDEAGRLKAGGLVVRLSDENGNPDPVYGAQIQTQAVQGVAPEATVTIRFEEHAETLDDGTSVPLWRPVAVLSDLAHGPLGAGTRSSLRLAPGLGSSAVIARAGSHMAGAGAAFGWKGSEPTLEAQIGLAFSRDLGLSTAAYPSAAGDCTAAQAACLGAPHGAPAGEVEIAGEITAALAAYLNSLSQPAPAPDSEGLAIFEATGCARCHTPQTATGEPGTGQLYSDLKVHDMGAGLADPAPSDGRKGSEWRTAPLSGAGSSLKQGGALLHDGRARTVAEAVLWHGGDAAEARDAYKRLSAPSRAALDAFVAAQ